MTPLSAFDHPAKPESWQSALASSIRDPDRLIDALRLPEQLREPARQAATLFPVFVTQSYLRRMTPGEVADPLLRQVLPIGDEERAVEGFEPEALGEPAYHAAPGLLQKYAGRALMIASGACAIHCRYCFRRHYPYGDEPRRMSEWEPAIQTLDADPSIHEIILSGGDPLTLTDARLAEIVARLDRIPHLVRLRIHTRLPIVLPERVTDRLIAILRGTRMTPIVVVHANHPAEVAGDCAERSARVRAGFTVLNQTVLLRGVNDSADSMAALCERLVDLGVMPYYLHQLDRVSGTAHFEVPEDQGRRIIEELRARLPGYAVPRYVRETPGETHKLPL